MKRRDVEARRRVGADALRHRGMAAHLYRDTKARKCVRMEADIREGAGHKGTEGQRGGETEA